MKRLEVKLVSVIALVVIAALLTTLLPGIPAYATDTTDTTVSAEPTPTPTPTPAVDYSNESNASLRMQPLKDKLSTLTAAELSAELSKYKDITAHWSKTQVCKLSSLEIIKGYTDNTFKPEKSVTVAEFITMTVKILGYKLEQNPKNWAQNFINQAIKDGIVKTGEFTDYNRAITREEVARIAVNAAMLYDTAPTHEMDNVVIKRLCDYNTIKDTNKQKVIDANLLGLMTTYSSTGKFMPRNKLTRAEAATVILRLLDNSARSPFVPKTTEMIKLSNKNTNQSYYLVNNNKPEVLPMTYKIIEAANLTKGYAAIGCNPEATIAGIILWESKSKYDNNTFGWDLDISVSLTPDGRDQKEHPYYMVIRNAKNTKALHMDFMTALIKMFYGTDSDKVLTEFNKCLNSAIANDDKEYKIWSYTSGVKYGGRGILLGRGANDPEIVMWIYSK